jgi:hypothetical protein
MSGAPTSSTEPNVGRAARSAGGGAPPSSRRALVAGGCRGSGRSRCCVPIFSASGMLSATATLTHSQSGLGQASRSGGGVAGAGMSGTLVRVTGAREAAAPAAPADMWRASGRSARSVPSGFRTGTRIGTATSTRSRSHPDPAAYRSGGIVATAAASGRRPRSGAVTAKAVAGRARGGSHRQLTAPAHARHLPGLGRRRPTDCRHLLLFDRSSTLVASAGSAPGRVAHGGHESCQSH